MHFARMLYKQSYSHKYLLHGPNNVDVTVKDDGHGHDEAKDKQVDDVGRRIRLVGVPINRTAVMAGTRIRLRALPDHTAHFFVPDIGHLHDVLAPTEYRWSGQQDGVRPDEHDCPVRVVVMCLPSGQGSADQTEALVGEDSQCGYRGDAKQGHEVSVEDAHGLPEYPASVNGRSKGEGIAQDGDGEVAAYQIQQDYVDRRPELTERAIKQVGVV